MTAFLIKSTIMKKFFLFCTLICSLQSSFATITTLEASKDSIKERRDEYFKGVQIVIDDKPNNVSINKQYEELTQEQKEYYLSNIPEREKARGIIESDFSSFTHNTDASYYLDNKKSTLSEILKQKREYYACAGYKRSGVLTSYYFYTYPYFKKNIKTLNDHYPEKTYKIRILNEVRDYLFDPELINIEKKSYERNGHAEEEQYNVSVSYMSYGYVYDTKNHSNKRMACFPGGRDKFIKYLFDNIKMPYSLEGQELRIDFTINTNGTLSDISMSEETDPLLASEVQRVMLNCPRWIPSQENGIAQPVGTRDYFKNNK
jgi:hypothetical protein